MGLYLILGMGMIVFVIFIISVVFMIGARMTKTENGEKEEVNQLRKRVEELETRMEKKEL